MALAKKVRCALCAVFAAWPALGEECDRGRARQKPHSYKTIADYVSSKAKTHAAAEKVTESAVNYHYSHGHQSREAA